VTGLLLLAAFAAVLLVTGAAEARARGDRAQRRHPRHTHQPRHARTPHPRGFPGWDVVEAEHDAWLATYDPPSPYQRRLPLILWERDTLAGGILRPIRAEVTG